MIENLFGGGGGGGGTVDTVVAGTGISVNSTDPANPIVTLGNHDASLITTGTVATARLGTGTANSTTYLAGDQTYKAAVTSVNGSTGAVTVAAGDTTYSMTVLDAENTTAERNLVSFVVPANTWLNGEIIDIEIYYNAQNQSGIAYNLTNKIYVGGFALMSSVNTFQSVIRYGVARYKLQRNGNNVAFYNGSLGSDLDWGAGEFAYPTYTKDVLGAYDQRFWDSFAVTFTNNLTVSIAAQWGTQNVTAYVRVLNARAYKRSGQQT